MDSYDIPPPNRWEDFEHLCRDLWAILWDDPSTRRHGRSGQPQAGVDVYGRPEQGTAWHGVQCKLKSQIAGSQLTRNEIVAEVDKAQAFTPPLAAFILATTAPRDVGVEEIVRQIAEEQHTQGSFPVTVRFWDDILEDLQGHEPLLRKHYERWRAAGSAGLRISTSRLPITGETFVAREPELARLDAAWEDGTNVISFVATGGAGKSALINRWLGQMQRDGWRGAERVLGWSFYSQGTNSAGASSEAFTEYALDWLGYTGDVITSPWKKGELLARLVRERRTLLILDGLEPLQHPPGNQTGIIKDPATRSLVRELAADNPGLCVIATRLKVADVAGRAGTEAVDLDKLPPEAGADLLRRLGVKGSEKELRAASEERGGHGLTLTLLGTYLRDICSGDIRRHNEVAVLDETAGIDGSDHARKVMKAYEDWLPSSPGGDRALQLLHLLGLFDRPAEPAALAALRTEPEILGLTEGIGASDETAWQAALFRLRKVQLVAPTDHRTTPTPGAADENALDTHPLIREYFGERLRQAHTESWRSANERLYNYYRNAAPDLPNTLSEMLPLYAAVVYGCRAGKDQEVLTEVYRRRIMRGDEFFSSTKLGAMGAELTALAALFERLWNRPSENLASRDRSWLLHEVGHDLHVLGRLPEAVEPLRSSLAADIALEDWQNSAITAQNLSQLLLNLGDLRSAIEAAEESVEYANRSAGWFERVANQASLADAVHQGGRWDRAEILFREAEALQAKVLPGYPRLSSLQGFWYCDLLLSRGEPEDGSGPACGGETYRQACREVRGRAEYAVEIAARNQWLRDIALDQLSLGRVLLGLAWTASDRPPDLGPATDALDQAVDGLREAAHEDYLPRGLLARATLRRLAGDDDAAAADLREAQEIAERGSMRLHEADAHLEWTRLHLATGDPAAAREHLDHARELVRACGYGRREREVTWLEGRLADLDGAEPA